MVRISAPRDVPNVVCFSIPKSLSLGSLYLLQQVFGQLVYGLKINIIHYCYFQEEEAQKRAVWEENMKMIKLHNGENGLGKNGFTMEMNAFGDMVSVTLIAAQCAG